MAADISKFEFPYPIAVSVRLSRNFVVQGLGLGMVILMALDCMPWGVVLLWTILAVATLGMENHLLKEMGRGGYRARRAEAIAPTLRVLATTLYALAAFALIVRGGPGERLFAFALMSASMVHVLMRYYRSPPVLLASLAPYILILGLAGLTTTRNALRDGHTLSAFASAFTIATFAIQFWAARSQLYEAWTALMAAREAAEARERAADAANRAKSDFLSTMSHELRTPLNGVLGMAQALNRERLTEAQRERVKIIQRSSESLLSVLNDLLDLSKIEAGALDLEVSEFDLEELIGGVACAYEPRARQKGLAFAVDFADAAGGAYRGDATRLRRILYSLADNAVKFTEAGGVRLRVERAEAQVVFRMTDTGIGIGASDLTHLFEGFFQADSSLTRRYGGAGVGLAMCRELAALMGGSIEAESVLGEGSAFTLRLPLERVRTAEAKLEHRDSVTPDDAEPKALRVLAAEDNPTNQLVLKNLLAIADIAPVIVENGREALEAWEGQAWDIILMDIQMPEMNGLEATHAIRRREADIGRPRTPILAVTANAMTHHVAEYVASGMDGVVPKPIALAHLFQAMEEALSPPSSEDALQAAG